MFNTIVKDFTEKFGNNKYWLFLFLSAIFGVITTIINYSGFGAGNQVVHLPVIIRLLDKSYLINDFFTNASMSSIARINYARIISIIAGSEYNLPGTFLLLTLCVNITISAVTYAFSHNLFRNSPMAGITASALVMSITTFELGYYQRIFSSYLEPAGIAAALIFLAIWLIAHGKCLISIIICGIASIFHPLYGLEMGGLLLTSFIILQIITRQKISKNNVSQVILGIFALAAFSLFSLLPQFSQEIIPSKLFIYLIAYFRHPHHYLPSTFSFEEYVLFTAFLITILIIYFKKPKSGNNPYRQIITILGIEIILLCIGGYVFVEIFPLRIWVIAQTFRLLFFVKWIGLIFIASVIADEQNEKSTRVLYSVGVLHPLATGGFVLSQALRGWLEQKRSWFSKVIDPSVILLVTIALMINSRDPIPLSSIGLLGLFLSLILIFDSFPLKHLHITILAGAILLVLFVSLRGFLPFLNQVEEKVINSFNLNSEVRSELGQGGDEVAIFVKENTPDKSIFLTPPMWGQFRFLARRAIVVDFKAFPFDDIAMQEWYERITNCYGLPQSKGFNMRDELVQNYQNIDDDTMLSLKEKYNISYAVLFNQTETNYKIIFQNNLYKVVKLVEN